MIHVVVGASLSIHVDSDVNHPSFVHPLFTYGLTSNITRTIHAKFYCQEMTRQQDKMRKILTIYYTYSPESSVIRVSSLGVHTAEPHV